MTLKKFKWNLSAKIYTYQIQGYLLSLRFISCLLKRKQFICNVIVGILSTIENKWLPRKTFLLLPPDDQDHEMFRHLLEDSSKMWYLSKIVIYQAWITLSREQYFQILAQKNISDNPILHHIWMDADRQLLIGTIWRRNIMVQEERMTLKDRQEHLSVLSTRLLTNRNKRFLCQIRN